MNEVPAESPGGWLARVRRAEATGDFLAAYDLAVRGLAEHPAELRLQHRAVLSLARSGATDRALGLFRSLGLEGRPEEDVAALGARLAKDGALAARGADRTARAGDAAESYEAVYARTGGYYPGVNAATLRFLAGETARAEGLARRVLEQCANVRPADPLEAYYVAATQAEAALVLGDAAAAGDHLRRARAAHGRDHAALATTRRQLRLICAARGIDPAVLAPLRAPRVIHFAGHRAPPGDEAELVARIAAHLETRDVGYGFGALASGADLLFAEALLSRGSELHVVLPFDAEEFKQVSVAPAGPGWIERFDRCLAAAGAVTFATEDAFLGDDLLFTYGSRLAMGLAVLRARHLDTEVEQVALWDGRPASGEAGTAVDVAFWKEKGLPSTVIPCPPAGGTMRRPAPAPPEAGGAPEGLALQGAGGTPAGPPRAARAMLFGDVKGFSKLRELQAPVFLKEVMGRYAEVLDGFGDEVLYRNTWGDGLYVVFRGASSAAACALRLQDATASIDLAALRLPPHLALRVGAHLGPVFEGYDPVIRRTMYFGSHVTRTARIEPATPEGMVYVTEPFAAALVLESADLACEYVGCMPAAKGYGMLRMYVLKRRETAVREARG